MRFQGNFKIALIAAVGVMLLAVIAGAAVFALTALRDTTEDTPAAVVGETAGAAVAPVQTVGAVVAPNPMEPAPVEAGSVQVSVDLSSTAVAVNEGSTASYTVELSHSPWADVTVSLSLQGPEDFTADKSSLTFTTSNWSTAQTVTLSAAEDSNKYDDTLTITHTGAGGGFQDISATLTATEDDNDNDGTLTASDATATTVLLTMTGYSGDWWHRRSGWNECRGPISDSSVRATELQQNKPSVIFAHHTSVCEDRDKITESNLFHTSSLTLTASNITATSVRLSISNWDLDYDGIWYFGQKDVWCSAPISQSYSDKSGLFQNTDYEYTAYSNGSCTQSLTPKLTFTTSRADVVVGNLDASGDGTNHGIGVLQSAYLGSPWVAKWWATSFTTGSAGNGYTLNSIVATFTDVRESIPYGFVAKLYPDNGTGQPSSSPRATLTGDTPTVTQGTYTCTASASNNCHLDPNTTYHLALGVGGCGSTATCYFQWKTTTSTSQTNSPSNAGWTIGDTSSKSDDGSSWSKVTGRSGRIKVNAE